jgi:hypothetical protein
MTFVTKIPLIFGQVTCDISCKRQGVLNEQKNQQIQVHPSIPLYMYCHM